MPRLGRAPALTLLVVGFVVLGHAAVARAANPGAERIVRELFQRSVVAYQAGHFDDAATLLRAAATIDPRPVLLYNLGRACERGGDQRCANDAYRRYLEAAPRAADRAAVEERLRALAPANPRPTPLPAPPTDDPAVVYPIDLKDPFATPSKLEPVAMLPDDGTLVPRPPPPAVLPPQPKPARQGLRPWQWGLIGSAIGVSLGVALGLGLGLGLSSR